MTRICNQWDMFTVYDYLQNLDLIDYVEENFYYTSKLIYGIRPLWTHFLSNPLYAINLFFLYYRSILDDVRWLLMDPPSESSQEAKEVSSDPWFGPVRHASDYFHTINKAAVYLIEHDLAYVDDLSPGNSYNYSILAYSTAG